MKLLYGDATIIPFINVLFALLTEIRPSKGQASPQDYNVYHNVQPGGSQNGQQQQQYDYTYPEQENTIPETQCYHCIYMVKNKQAVGRDNCRDPFRKEDIGEVSCQGSCAKIYQQTGENEYTLTRGCLHNCKPYQDNKGYTQCCNSHLCNGASRTARSATSSFTFYVISVLSTAICLLTRQLVTS